MAAAPTPATEPRLASRAMAPRTRPATPSDPAQPKPKRRRRPAGTPPRPPGRPSPLLELRHVPAPGGGYREVTVADRIVELLASGTYVERAARATGIAKGTLYGWLDLASTTRELLALHGDNADVTEHARACVAFSDAVDTAEATYELTALTALEQLAAGRVTLETVTERYERGSDGTDVLVERTVKRQGLAPNPNVITWKLTRRFPERYQLRPATVDPGAGAGAEPDLSAEAVRAMLADLDAFTLAMDPGTSTTAD